MPTGSVRLPVGKGPEGPPRSAGWLGRLVVPTLWRPRARAAAAAVALHDQAWGVPPGLSLRQAVALFQLAAHGVLGVQCLRDLQRLDRLVHARSRGLVKHVAPDRGRMVDVARPESTARRRLAAAALASRPSELAFRRGSASKTRVVFACPDGQPAFPPARLASGPSRLVGPGSRLVFPAENLSVPGAMDAFPDDQLEFPEVRTSPEQGNATPELREPSANDAAATREPGSRWRDGPEAKTNGLARTRDGQVVFRDGQVVFRDRRIAFHDGRIAGSDAATGHVVAIGVDTAGMSNIDSRASLTRAVLVGSPWR